MTPNPAHGLLAQPPADRAAPARKGVVHTEGSVADLLFNQGCRFNFFQAVRLLEKLLPNQSPVGHRGPVGAEVARFSAHVSLNFPPSQIYEITRPTRKLPVPGVVVAFMGLFGPSGVLPRHYTELLISLRYRIKGPERHAMRDWLDLYNHRLVSLFYRAWEKYRFFIPYERQEYDLREPDSFTRAMLSLAGLGTGSLRYRLASGAIDAAGTRRELARVDDLSLIYYSGWLAHRPRSAGGLQAMLQDYFQFPVEVVQFQGQWLQLARENQTELGARDGNSRLGVDAVAGERVWDVQSKFRIRVGPLSYDRFSEMLPDRAACEDRKSFFMMAHLVRLYAGPEFDFDIQLLMAAEDVPECRLASSGIGPRLGWNTWLPREPTTVLISDVIINAQELFDVVDVPAA